MATCAASRGNVQKVAVLSYGHRTGKGQQITEALASLGHQCISLIDVNLLIESPISTDGYPDRRCGGSVKAQRDIIKNAKFAILVVECLKTSTLEMWDSPIFIRVSDGPTVADIVSGAEAECLNLICTDDGVPTFEAMHWVLDLVAPEIMRTELINIVRWCEEPSTIEKVSLRRRSTQSLGPHRLGYDEKFGYLACLFNNAYVGDYNDVSRECIKQLELLNSMFDQTHSVVQIGASGVYIEAILGSV